MYYQNIFYFYYLNKCGGVESMLYYLSKKYRNRITILYTIGDSAQITRLSQFAEVVQLKNQIVECHNFFTCYSVPDIEKQIYADNYYLIIHADYKDLKIKPLNNKFITKYIGVSQQVANSYSSSISESVDYCYNPIVKDNPKKILHLISATRLTKEKGYSRMIKLASKLDEENIPFIWNIFTDKKPETKPHPHMIFLPSTYDIQSYIADADYLVQLSDTEAFCYSVVEALLLSTPVIITPCPVYKELNIKENIDAFFIDFDLQNLDVQNIYNKKLHPDWKPPKDEWYKYLTVNDSPDEYKYLIEATDKYQKHKTTDIVLNKIPNKGEKWWVTKDRLNYLLEHYPQYINFLKREKLDK